MIRELLFAPFNSLEKKYIEVESILYSGIQVNKKEIFTILGFLVFGSYKGYNSLTKCPISPKESVSLKIYNNSDFIEEIQIQNKNPLSFLSLEPYLKPLHLLVKKYPKCNILIKIENEDLNFRSSVHEYFKASNFENLKTSDAKREQFIIEQIKELDENFLIAEVKSWMWNSLPPNTDHLDEYFLSHIFSQCCIDYEEKEKLFDLIINKKKGSY